MLILDTKEHYINESTEHASLEHELHNKLEHLTIKMNLFCHHKFFICDKNKRIKIYGKSNKYFITSCPLLIIFCIQ